MLRVAVTSLARNGTSAKVRVVGTFTPESAPTGSDMPLFLVIPRAGGLPRGQDRSWTVDSRGFQADLLGKWRGEVPPLERSWFIWRLRRTRREYICDLPHKGCTCRIILTAQDGECYPLSDACASVPFLRSLPVPGPGEAKLRRSLPGSGAERQDILLDK